MAKILVRSRVEVCSEHIVHFPLHCMELALPYSVKLTEVQIPTIFSDKAKK